MITTGRIIEPPRITLYGVEGIGKTDFGASSIKPVFIPVEDGSNELDVARFPKPKDTVDFRSYLDYLLNNETEYKTLVIDSADWLERLVWDQVCSELNCSSIEDPGYGKGYNIAAGKFKNILSLIDKVRIEREMAIVFLVHARVKRYDSPETEPYDRYQMKTHDGISGLLSEWSDVVLFANYKVYINKTDVGFKKTVRRAIGGEERVMYTSQKPAFKAKNRYNGLPQELPFKRGESWSTLMEAIKNTRQ